DGLFPARSQAEHAGANLGHVSKCEQALDGSVLAESAVQNGENNVDIDGTIRCAASESGIGLEGREGATGFFGLWWNHDRLAGREYRSRRSGVWIAGTLEGR